LVGSWLFCIQHLPYAVKFYWVLGGSVVVWTKSMLYWFSEGQTHFGMPRGAKTSLSFKFVHYLRACSTSGKKLLLLYAKQPIETIGD
jgi:hypothetical protein